MKMGGRRGARGFTLIELLMVVGTVSVLVALLLPSLAGARDAARQAVCASNLRQVQLANGMYADDHGRLAPGASDFVNNLHRWHGTRASASSVFTASGGALTPYLDPTRDEGGPALASTRSTAGAGEWTGVRTCPSFAGVLRRLASVNAGFERGNGGYGYNNSYLGVTLGPRASDGSRAIVNDQVGADPSSVFDPSGTVSFGDAAFAVAGSASGGLGVIEYSFAEPLRQVENVQLRNDPSLHFRHGSRTANIAWVDGHVSGRVYAESWTSGLYSADPRSVDIGFFAGDARVVNSAFDLD